MAKLELMRASCIEDSVTALVDGLCIQCVTAHTKPRECRVPMCEWVHSRRYLCAPTQSATNFVSTIRRERVQKVLGR